MNEPKNLAEIDTHASWFADESGKLETMVDDLQADLEKVKSKHLNALKRQAGVVARANATLISAVEANPGLFEKPRTLVLHGIKVGLGNSKGRVEWDDDETVVRLVRKFFADDADLLLQETVTPKKDALRTLPAGDLAKLGCRIVGAGDQVIVRREAGDVEKLIERLTAKLVEKMIATEA